MKIAFAIFKYFPWGGLQKDFMRTMSEVAARGHEVTCFTGSWEGEIPSFIHVEMLPLKKVTNHGRAAEFEKLFAEKIRNGAFDRTVTFNRIGGTDVYFAGDDCYAAGLAHKSRLLRLFPRYRTFLRQEKNILNPAAKTHILYLDQRQKNDYMAYYGTQEERFTFLPPTGEPECMRNDHTIRLREAKRKELNLSDDQLLLISVAADFHCKGIDRTLNAVVALPEDIRKKCVLCLIGGSDPKRRKQFIQQSEQLGIKQQTIFAGPRDDVYAYLAAADLMVHPARKEAAGTVLAEALASGVPIICSAVCGYASIVGDAGVVIPEPFDAKTFVGLLTETLNRLPHYKEKAMEVSGTFDFTRRAAIAADVITSR